MLPPGMPGRFGKIRFAPRTTLEGDKIHGGYLYLSMALITFIAEDSSTPNRINVYDFMPCSQGEVLCQGPQWTGSVRGDNGVTRMFEHEPTTTNDTTRTLKVPYYGSNETSTTDDEHTTGRWLCPSLAWGAAAGASWPDKPDVNNAAYHPSVQ